MSLEADRHVIDMLQSLSDFNNESQDQAHTRDKQQGLSPVFQPPEPFVDIVFVHSLWGSARYSWSWSRSLNHFWPQYWLPRDRRFKHARMSVYGYTTESLNIHDPDSHAMESVSRDFMQTLIESPHINEDPKTFIILVGHGIGGIVNKKLFMLSDKDEQYKQIAPRLKRLVFLATPHNRSGDQKMLATMYEASRNMGAVSGDDDKPDKMPDMEDFSAKFKPINDEFKRYPHSLLLYSFYEEGNAPVFGSEIATMPHKSETCRSYKGQFNEITQFEAPTDENYKRLVNTLAEIVEGLVSEASAKFSDETRKNMQALEDYLKPPPKSEKQLDLHEQKRSPGTCEWILRSNEFQSWQENRERTPQFFWLQGPPTSGKSVLAAYLVRHLQNLNLGCSYFFFDESDKALSSAASMFCSIAFQMAKQSRNIRRVLLNLKDTNVQLDNDNPASVDPASIFQKVFIDGIFGTPFLETHYWVIDAVDECSDLPTLLGRLRKINANLPLCIFFTSREASGLQNQFNDSTIPQLYPNSFYQVLVDAQNTREDIKHLLNAKKKMLPVDIEHDRDRLLKGLLDNSENSFLWASLVLEGFGRVLLDTDVEVILSGLPYGMSKYYVKMVNAIDKDKNPSAKLLVKSVLPWVVCAERPLRIDELSEALRHAPQPLKPIGLETQLESICHQLIRLDRETKEVKMIHKTAREFFLRPESRDTDISARDISKISELCGNEADCDANLAIVCLNFLLSDKLLVPIYRNRQSKPRSTGPFASYACVFFSYHLVNIADSAEMLAKTAMAKLERFLRSTKVLSWLEVLLEAKNIDAIIQTSHNLKRLVKVLEGRGLPYLDSNEFIREWATDLIYIVTRFGPQLLNAPFAIYFLVAPLCPTETAIHRCFGNNTEGLIVKGLRQQKWEDQLACIRLPNYDRSYSLSALAVRDDAFALAQKNGRVVIYDSFSCQEVTSINTVDTAVVHLSFGRSRSILAVATRDDVNVWRHNSAEKALEYEHVTRMRVAQEPLAISFSKDDKKLYVVTKGSIIHISELTGDRQGTSESKELVYPSKGVSPGQPERAAFFASHKVMAIAYRGKPIWLWDLDQKEWMKSIVRDTRPGHIGAGISWMAFHPDKELKLLIASYSDGEVLVFDTTTGSPGSSPRRLAELNTSCFTISPDGKKIAFLQAEKIRIHNFDDGALEYGIPCPWTPTHVSFGHKSERLLAYNAEQCNIWEPGRFLTKGSDSSESGISSRDVDETTVSSTPYDREPIISTMAYMPGNVQSKGVVFYGTENGKVCVKDLDRMSEPGQDLYSHEKVCAITMLAVSDNYIVSADNAGCIKIYEKSNFKGKWKCKLKPLNMPASKNIVRFLTLCAQPQLLVCAAGDKMMIRNLDDPKDEMPDLQLENADSLRFSRLPGQTQVILMTEGSDEVLSINCRTNQGSKLPHAKFLTQALAYVELCKNNSVRERLYNCINELIQLRFLDRYPLEKVSKDSSNNEAVAQWQQFFVHQRQSVGVHEDRLIFLDWNNWICSIDLDGVHTGCYQRHFFLPIDWVPHSRKSLIWLSQDGALIIGKDLEIVMIENGLSHGDEKTWPALHFGDSGFEHREVVQL